jgi:hypothetical protein
VVVRVVDVVVVVAWTVGLDAVDVAASLRAATTVLEAATTL